MSVSNTNPTTGIPYTVYALNRSIDSDVAQELFYGLQARDLSYEDARKELEYEIELDADELEDEVRIALNEEGGMTPREFDDAFEKRCEEMYENRGYKGREDYVETRLERRSEDIQIEEPVIEGTYEGITYGINWLGGAPLLWVFHSPYKGTFSQCSPCVPGACMGDSPDPNGCEGYAVPDDWLVKDESKELDR